MRAWNRALIIPFLGLAFVVLYTPPRGNGEDPRPTDAFQYAWSAIHFVEHGTYAVEAFGRVHPPRYPPGFPLFFLAPLYAVAGPHPGLGVLPVLASALGVLALLWYLARRILGAWTGAAAAFGVLFCLLQVYYFQRCARAVLSDIPALLLSFLCLISYRRAAEEGRARYFLIGALLTALAFQVRWTCLALALPFAVLLLRRGPGRGRRFAALALPLLVSAGATLLHQHRTFGHPLFTGYQYWISEKADYALSPAHVPANLRAFLHPFHASGRIPSGPAAAAGPLALLLCAGLGAACRRFRPGPWKASAPLRAFLLWAALPVACCHLFYPYHLARFVLLFHVLLFSCGILWGFALLDRQPKRVVFLLGLLAAAGAYPARTEKGAGAASYRTALLREAGMVLPADGVFLSSCNFWYVDRRLLRNTGRIFIPLDPTGKLSRRTLGRYGKPRRPLFPFTASAAPEKIGELLRSGRKVFLDRLQPEWSGAGAVVRSLLDRYEAVTVWRWRGKDALVELRLH